MTWVAEITSKNQVCEMISVYQFTHFNQIWNFQYILNANRVSKLQKLNPNYWKYIFLETTVLRLTRSEGKRQSLKCSFLSQNVDRKHGLWQPLSGMPQSDEINLNCTQKHFVNILNIFVLSNTRCYYSRGNRSCEKCK